MSSTENPNSDISPFINTTPTMQDSVSISNTMTTPKGDKHLRKTSLIDRVRASSNNGLLTTIREQGASITNANLQRAVSEYQNRLKVLELAAIEKDAANLKLENRIRILSGKTIQLDDKLGVIEDIKYENELLHSKLREVEAVKDKLIHHLNIAKMNLKILETTKYSSSGNDTHKINLNSNEEDMKKLNEMISSLTRAKDAMDAQVKGMVNQIEILNNSIYIIKNDLHDVKGENIELLQYKQLCFKLEDRINELESKEKYDSINHGIAVSKSITEEELRTENNVLKQKLEELKKKILAEQIEHQTTKKQHLADSQKLLEQVKSSDELKNQQNEKISKKEEYEYAIMQNRILKLVREKSHLEWKLINIESHYKLHKKFSQHKILCLESLIFKFENDITRYQETNNHLQNEHLHALLKLNQARFGEKKDQTLLSYASLLENQLSIALEENGNYKQNEEKLIKEKGSSKIEVLKSLVLELEESKHQESINYHTLENELFYAKENYRQEIYLLKNGYSAPLNSADSYTSTGNTEINQSVIFGGRKIHEIYGSFIIKNHKSFCDLDEFKKGKNSSPNNELEVLLQLLIDVGSNIKSDPEKSIQNINYAVKMVNNILNIGECGKDMEIDTLKSIIYQKEQQLLNLNSNFKRSLTAFNQVITENNLKSPNLQMNLEESNFENISIDKSHINEVISKLDGIHKNERNILLAQLTLSADANKEIQKLLSNADQKIKDLTEDIAKKKLELDELNEKFKRISSDYDKISSKLDDEVEKSRKNHSESENNINSLTIAKRSLQKELEDILSQTASNESRQQTLLITCETMTKEFQAEINLMKADSEQKNIKILDLESQLEKLNGKSTFNYESIHRELSMKYAGELSILQKENDQKIIQIHELNSKLLENQEFQRMLKDSQKSGSQQVLKN